MANRERRNELKIYLSDDEQYILEQKVKASGMKSKSTFLRRLILYGFVYDLDYSELREYNYTLGKISGNHICCVVTNRCSTRYSSIFRLAYDYLSGAKFLRYLTAGVIKTAALFFKATVS